MRQITKDAVNAFKNNQNFNRSNTTVTSDTIETRFILFGHCIAVYNKLFKTLQTNNCGYETYTTKERLNGILQAYKLGYIYQKKRVWYYVDNYGLESIAGQKLFFQLKDK